MRTLILLSCAVVGCLAFLDLSDLKRRLSSPDTSEAIADTVRIMHHTGMKKRQDTSNVNYVQTAFDMTDANGDGHITAHEYATFYVNNAPTFGLSYVQWVQALAMTLSQVDTNDNGKLEIDEYQVLACMGGYFC